jgi:hypothetical protein
MTTIILSASFVMYLFSPVANLARIGLLASVKLLAALLTDYLLTPVLIAWTKPFGKEQGGDVESGGAPNMEQGTPAQRAWREGGQNVPA